MGKYDKLIKENLSRIIIPLAKRLGVELEGKHLEMLKDKLQYTVEREPDLLFKVCHANSEDDHAVQIDFQSDNDGTMPERILFYRSMVKFVHKLSVRQIVLYIGNEPLTMENYIDEPNLFFKYELYDIRAFSAKSFLESDIPEEVLLAILGDFEGDTAEEMMEKILLRLQSLIKRKKDFQKYTFHLHVLSGLRKLHGIYQKKIKTMELKFDIHLDTDPIFLEGIEIGEEKGIVKGIVKGIEIGEEKGMEKGKAQRDYAFVSSLLLNTDHSYEKIAFLANVTLAFVESVAKSLK
jgi:hypothetical protein